jgi:hypothetical protein
VKKKENWGTKIGMWLSYGSVSGQLCSVAVFLGHQAVAPSTVEFSISSTQEWCSSQLSPDQGDWKLEKSAKILCLL